jgi:hypothetical protein
MILAAENKYGTDLTTLEPRKLSRSNERLRAGRQRSRSSSPGRVKTSHVSVSSRPTLGHTQLSTGSWGGGAHSPEVKGQGREADHSPPTSAEVKRTWICTATPQYVLFT